MVRDPYYSVIVDTLSHYCFLHNLQYAEGREPNTFTIKDNTGDRGVFSYHNDIPVKSNIIIGYLSNAGVVKVETLEVCPPSTLQGIVNNLHNTVDSVLDDMVG